MEGQEGLDKLFFELASESRLGILYELQGKNLKMQEVGQKLGLTHTEVFRQLQRLNEALLIQKQLDGSYAITQNGILLVRFADAFKFVAKFKQTLLTRDIQRIPYQFVNRIGELSKAHLSTNSIEMVNSAEQLITGAEKYLWIIGERPLSFLGAKAAEKVQKGLSIKLLFDESCSKYYEDVAEVKGIVEKRAIAKIPAILIINEKCAGINMFSVDGRADNAIFFGSDSTLLKWANDLFLYYWEQGKRFYPV
jgi:predicted transcriptional regulator